MNKSGKTKYCLALLSGILALNSCQSNRVQEKEEEEKKKYNVLFISIDDLRTELNCYGANHIKSPNIDQLASQGVRFTEAHVQQAICMASRASVMTGIRPEKHGIYTGESVESLLPDVLTLNKFFKQNGYSIAATGKVYHHGIDHKNQSGDDYMTQGGTWTGRGYVTEEAIKQIDLNPEGRGPAYEYADVHDTIYQDGLNTFYAVKKMEELKNEDKPFFLAVGLKKPHLPFVAPEKYWDMYPESSVMLPEITEWPENTGEHTMRLRGEINHYYGIPHMYDEIDDSTALILRRAYYACVS
ncbi:MAG: sulfatase-like hydrolase/transferase [Bacteroidota bacterium]